MKFFILPAITLLCAKKCRALINAPNAPAAFPTVAYYVEIRQKSRIPCESTCGTARLLEKTTEMADTALVPPSSRLTGVQWAICAVAALGFAFDTYELLVLPLIVRPALMEMAKVRPGSPEFNSWVGLLFYVPALAGGVFGLLGGYLTDRLGRRRVLVWSILLYAFSALGAGYATSLPMLLVLRCTTFVGVCVEFVAAVAWLAELFPERDRREKILGYTQALSSIGGLMVTAAYYLAVTYIALFAIPFSAAHRLSERPSLWLKSAAGAGLAISILYSVFSVFPIIEVKDWRSFTAKIVSVLVLTNLIGLAIYAAGRRRVQTTADDVS